MLRTKTPSLTSYLLRHFIRMQKNRPKPWPRILAGRVFIGLVAVTLSACAGQPDYRAETAPPPTVERVDLQRYAGLWHEIARYPNRFQRGCLTTTATYAVIDATRISVLNACGKADGESDSAEGVARVIEGSNGSKLKVRFAPAWIPFAEGDYWVLHLEEDYSAALVGDPKGRFLWILGRAPQLEDATKERILKKALTLGYETSPLVFATP
ncbi:MAG: lipocalin family protein [Pseudomonadota bacterium]